MIRPKFKSGSLFTLLPMSALMLTACGGPRTVVLDERDYDNRPPGYPIPVYDGTVLEAHREIAMIETRGYEADTEETRDRMYDELKRKARSYGGDAVQDVRVLTKQIKGYTVDERTPFLSWKQGRYPLYFMRGEVVTYESGLPGAVSTGVGFVDGAKGFIPPGSEDDVAVELEIPSEPAEMISLPDGLTIRSEPLSKNDGDLGIELEETPALDSENEALPAEEMSTPTIDEEALPQ